MLGLPGLGDAGDAVHLPPCPPSAPRATTCTINRGNDLIGSSCTAGALRREGCCSSPGTTVDHDSCTLAACHGGCPLATIAREHFTELVAKICARPRRPEGGAMI